NLLVSCAHSATLRHTCPARDQGAWTARLDPGQGKRTVSGHQANAAWLSMRAVWLYHVVRLSQPNVEPLLAERVPLSAWSPRSSPSTPAGWSGIWAAYRHLIKLNKSFDYKCRKRREATRDFTVSVP